MNREQKAAAVEEIASQIAEAEAIFAIDYQGISVPQAAELRTRLNEADARFRIVKNRLTKLAAEKAGREQLIELLEGPIALTFVKGDTASAAKAIDRFNRQHNLLEFKGGLMDGETLEPDQFKAIARLPALDVLHGQFAGMVASPLTGLVRGLNQLIAGLAIQLSQMHEQGLVSSEAAAEEEPAAAEEPAQETPAEEPASESSAEVEPEPEGEPPQAEGEAPEPEETSEETSEKEEEDQNGN
jgi:large subunit ribosomal protein L10